MTNPYAAAMSAYKDNAVSTASPARVVVMAYERLVIDFERALACFDAKLPASQHLLHAQDLILALQSKMSRSGTAPSAFPRSTHTCTPNLSPQTFSRMPARFKTV